MVPSAVTNKEFPNKFGAILINLPATRSSQSSSSLKILRAPGWGRTLQLVGGEFKCDTFKDIKIATEGCL